MKSVFLRLLNFSLCLWFGLAAARGQDSGQEAPAAGSGVQSTMTAHPAVLRAEVLREQVVTGGAESGGELIIRRIAEPVLTPEELAAAEPVPARLLTAPEQAARQAALEAARLARPLETRLFSPDVLIFPDGVALIRWWSVDASHEFQTHGVWVTGVDFSLLPAVNELNAGRRRWLVTACSVRDAAVGRSAQGITPPSPADFAAGAGFAGGAVALVEEGGGDAAALEPLTALITELTANAGQLSAVTAARKAAQEQADTEAAARAQLPPAPSVIRFWTSDADEVSTLAKSLPDQGGR